MRLIYAIVVLTIFAIAREALCEEPSNLLVDVYRQELQTKQEALYKPISDLNELYRKNLEALKKRHQQSGDLDRVLAVDAEIKAIGTDEKVDPASDGELRQLQNTYTEAKEARSEALEKEFSNLVHDYLEKLEKLQSDLTREGKMEDAVAVRSESEFVRILVARGKLIPVADWMSEKRRLSLIPEDAIEFGGHKYKLYDESLNWHEAKSKCEELGGNLVSIGSKDEDKLIASLRDGRYFLWIGLVSDSSGMKWRWVDGTDYEYTNWRDDRPDNTGGLNSVVMNRWDQWDDTPPESGNVPAFVCEWE